MFRHLKTRARRGARRVLFATLCGISAAVGAGFASAALFAALLQAGQSIAMAGLILACIWFGLSGLFLLLKAAVGDEAHYPADHRSADAPGASHGAHPNAHAATAPSVAEAFVAGMSEGAGFARSQQRSAD